jgi:uncharacterized phage infection (PIP) family protein YhgE
MHHDNIASSMTMQVTEMILEAKRKNEYMVGKEVQRIKKKMESMNEKMNSIAERLKRLDPANSGFLKVDLQKSVTKLEEVWEGEVGTLKHELWQTIQAHNHNADLLKHHKDAIDHIQGRMAESTPNPELEQIHSQLLQVDKMLQREQAKEQQMDQLMQRLNGVQQQIAANFSWTGMPTAFSMPSVQQTAGVSAVSKKAQRKTTKALKGAKSTGSSPQLAPTLRAEAPEFVPTSGWSDDNSWSARHA